MHKLLARDDFADYTKLINRLAKQTGFIHSKTKKFKPVHFLTTCFHGLYCANFSLRKLAKTYGEKSTQLYSKTSMFNCFNQTLTAFLREFIEEALKKQEGSHNQKLRPRKDTLYQRVLVEDSTQLSYHANLSEDFPGHGTQHGQTAGANINLTKRFATILHAKLSKIESSVRQL